jgi:hypothetical protein
MDALVIRSADSSITSPAACLQPGWSVQVGFTLPHGRGSGVEQRSGTLELSKSQCDTREVPESAHQGAEGTYQPSRSVNFIAISHGNGKLTGRQIDRL